MAYSWRAGRTTAYDISKRWQEECVLSDESLLTTGRPIWSVENLEDLKDRFVDRPDFSGGTFEAKFEQQLAGAPQPTIQLAAECLYLYFLVAAGVGEDAKRGLIERVLGWMEDPPSLPDNLVKGLQFGLMGTGQGYNQFRPHQLWFLIESVLALKRLSDAERRQELADPWRTKELLESIPLRSAYIMRNVLLHLFHPETFEDIAGHKHKERIARHYGQLTDETDVDRALLEIRRRMEQERGGRFDFYMSEVRREWDPREGPRRAWFVRGANVQGKNLVPKWLAEGFCSIGWLRIGEIVPPVTQQQIYGTLKQGYPDASPNTLRNWAGQLRRFVNEMSEGDLVVTVDGSTVHFGVITSPEVEWVLADDSLEAEVAEVEDCPRRRSVAWSPITAQREDLPLAVASKLKALLTVTEVTDVLPELENILRGDEGDDGDEEDGDVKLLPVEHHLREPAPELARRLHLPIEWLTELVDLLRDKQQVILFGPPGTGKTYVATKLAEHLVEDPGDTQLVQFHPSYAYEDFFEGYRPAQSEAGTIVFELQPGPLRLLAAEADKNPGRTYILVIDEINRANLAKVFGELYFALEYRETAIRLQYSPGDPFTLPRNLYFIGTMNTADRSIALVDAAMRRRFYFMRLAPSEPPVDHLLRRWLADEEHPPLAADLLDELNRRIDDADAAIGHSYLMAAPSHDATGYVKVWKRAIIPLLEEHFLGTGRDVEAELGFAAVFGAVQRQ